MLKKFLNSPPLCFVKSFTDHCSDINALEVPLRVTFSDIKLHGMDLWISVQLIFFTRLNAQQPPKTGPGTSRPNQRPPVPINLFLMIILFPFSSLYTLANNDFFAKKGSKKIIITDKHEKLRLSGPEKYKICKNVVPKIWAPSRFNWEPAATLLP